MSERKLKFDTLQVHAGQKADPTTGSSNFISAASNIDFIGAFCNNLDDLKG